MGLDGGEMFKDLKENSRRGSRGDPTIRDHVDKARGSIFEQFERVSIRNPIIANFS